MPIAEVFEVFGRTNGFFEEIKGSARSLRQKCGSFQHSLNETKRRDLASAAAILLQKVNSAIDAIGGLVLQPAGLLPFPEVISKLDNAIEEVPAMNDLLRKSDLKEDKGILCSHYLSNLDRELHKARASFQKADRHANGGLLLLDGEAGTGKTHLLCDVAHRRLADDRPTILLMGQRFTSTEDPWEQVLKQVDLRKRTAGELVGALEAAAQANNCRALVIIDALNEGQGRAIWPDNLPAFLAHLERSPWIGVVLSVRSFYEEIIIPESVRNQAIRKTHHGFAGHEYDAVEMFFRNYGLELPSTPLLSPEFSNPLFLSILCKALMDAKDKSVQRQ